MDDGLIVDMEEINVLIDENIEDDTVIQDIAAILENLDEENI